MSLDNRYILSKNGREKLERWDKNIFFIIILGLLFLCLFTFSRIENKLLYILIMVLISTIDVFIITIEYIEKSKRITFSVFVLTFFICSTLSFIANFINFINENNFLLIDINLYGNKNKFLLIISILGIYSFIVGTLLLFLNSFINVFLIRYLSNKLKFEIDTVSNSFAVDVLTYTIYIGALFVLIAYGLFYSEGNQASFFSGVNVTHVALATVGVVTFFWAAKSVKSKSIELDISRSREVGRLFSEGTVFLSAPHNGKKYVGLSYLNMIAGQSKAPLQKEAIDLMANFILNANDVTTANKPRIRAMEYLSDRLTTDFWDYDIDELIKLSSSELTESNVNYRFSQLNIVYENFMFSNEKKFLNSISYNNEESNDKEKCIIKRLFYRAERKLTTYIERNFINNINRKLVAYNNCNFEKFSGQNGIEKIILIYANDCCFKKCKIGIVKGYSKKLETLSTTGQKGNFTPLNNKFEQCDFSDSDGWNILRPSNRMEGGNAETIAENAFINCFYYSGHEPKGFVKERDGALLAEITSKEQFEELIGSSLFMYYSPPDGKR